MKVDIRINLGQVLTNPVFPFLIEPVCPIQPVFVHTLPCLTIPVQTGEADISSANQSSGGSDIDVAPPTEEWGMKILEVAPDGAAAEASLQANDIIMNVGDRRVQSFEELTAALAAADGPVELVFINGENNQLEKLTISPVKGKVGIATEAVVVK